MILMVLDMKKQMVVTNLRIEKNAWRQVKSLAGELGMSVNEYLNSLVWENVGFRQLNGSQTIRAKTGKKEEKFWEIYKIAKMINKPMGASPEDKIIYGVRD